MSGIMGEEATKKVISLFINHKDKKEDSMTEITKDELNEIIGGQEDVYFTPLSEYQYVLDPNGTDVRLMHYIGSSQNIVLPSTFYVEEDQSTRNTIIDSSGLYANSSSVENIKINDGVKLNAMKSMFQSCPNLQSIEFGDVDISTVTNMQTMCSGCTKLVNVDLRGLDTINVDGFGGMFQGCSSLEQVLVSRDKWATVQSSESSYIFSGANISSVMYDGYDDNPDMVAFPIPEYPIRSQNITIDRSSRVITIKNMTVPTSGTLIIPSRYESFNIEINVNGMSFFPESGSIPKNNLLHLIIEDDVIFGNSLNYLCDNCTGLSSVQIGAVNSEKLTNMTRMFYGCTALESIYGLNNIDTTNVTESEAMFYGCSSLSSLNLTGWDTQRNVNMNEMFNNCSNLVTILATKGKWAILQSVEAGNGAAGSASDINASIFRGCKCNNVTYENYSGYVLPIGDFAITVLTEDNQKFLILHRHDMPTARYNSDYVIDTITIPATYSDGVCEYKVGINSYLNPTTRSFENYAYPNQKINNMIIDSGVTLFGATYLFQSSRLTNLTIGNIDSSRVTSMECMFKDFGGNITGLENLDTSNVTTMYEMFLRCSELTSLDLTSWDTSNVTSMVRMFAVCESLIHLDLTSFDTSSVINVDLMFNSCTDMSEILVSSSWSIDDSVTGKDTMFLNCGVSDVTVVA